MKKQTLNPTIKYKVFAIVLGLLLALWPFYFVADAPTRLLHFGMIAVIVSGIAFVLSFALSMVLSDDSGNRLTLFLDGLRFLLWFGGHGFLWVAFSLLFPYLLTQLTGALFWTMALMAGCFAVGIYTLLGMLWVKHLAFLRLCWVVTNEGDYGPQEAVIFLRERYNIAFKQDVTNPDESYLRFIRATLDPNSPINWSHRIEQSRQWHYFFPELFARVRALSRLFGFTVAIGFILFLSLWGGLQDSVPVVRDHLAPPIASQSTLTPTVPSIPTATSYGDEPNSEEQPTPTPSPSDDGASDQSGEGNGENTSGQSSDGSGDGTSDQSGDRNGEDANGQSGEGSGDGISDQSGDSNGEGASGQSGEGSSDGASDQSGDSNGEDANGQSGDSDGEDANSQSSDGSGDGASDQSGDRNGEDANGQSGEGSGDGASEQSANISETDEAEGEQRGFGTGLSEPIFGDFSEPITPAVPLPSGNSSVSIEIEVPPMQLVSQDFDRTDNQIERTFDPSGDAPVSEFTTRDPTVNRRIVIQQVVPNWILELIGRP